MGEVIGVPSSKLIYNICRKSRINGDLNVKILWKIIYQWWMYHDVPMDLLIYGPTLMAGHSLSLTASILGTDYYSPALIDCSMGV